MNNELYHYGILGMKWGVRRYLNADGNLNNRGRKHYTRMSNDKLRKKMYKQVRKERARQTGWSNQWASGNTIGKNSKSAVKKYSDDLKKWRNSDIYKQSAKQIKRLDDDYGSGRINVKKYDSEHRKISKNLYKPELDNSTTYTSNGRKYSNEFLNKYGRDITIGYLKDLGYDEKTAKEFTNRILKSRKKLMTI